LEAFDAEPIPYDPYSIFSHILTLRGRNFSMMAAPLLVLTVWGLSWQLIFRYALEPGSEYSDQIHIYISDVQDTIASLDDLINQFLLPVSFLFAFRLGCVCRRSTRMCLMSIVHF
jgi:hypothetical protein